MLSDPLICCRYENGILLYHCEQTLVITCKICLLWRCSASYCSDKTDFVKQN